MAQPDAEWRYAVGWKNDQGNIVRFGDNFATTFDTPEEAQAFLDLIGINNSADNLKVLCGGGVDRLFVIAVTPVWPDRSHPWESTHKRELPP